MMADGRRVGGRAALTVLALAPVRPAALPILRIGKVRWKALNTTEDGHRLLYTHHPHRRRDDQK
jgi:hypothetical protein